MIKKLFFISLILLLGKICAKDLAPKQIITTAGNVIDLNIKKDKLYIATTAGIAQVYDIKNNKLIKEIKLKDIHDFMGDLIHTRICSIDQIGDKILLIADGEHGFTEMFIQENNQTKKVIGIDSKLSIVKARFIDKNRVLLALLSNEIILYDINKKREIYKKQISQSKFSDFALNEDRTKVVIACESGINYLVNIKNGQTIKELKGGNKDNIFKISYKNGKIATASQDKISTLYNEKGDIIHTFKAPFFIYAVGLNNDATKLALSYGEKNDIAIFNLKTYAKEYMLKGQKSILNNLIFYTKNILFSGSNDKNIIKWSLK